MRPEIGVAIGIIGVVLAVAGIGFGYYLYRAAQNLPELSFQKSVVQVFNAGSSSRGIHVIGFAGEPIESNVYAAEIVVWNSGTAPVRQDDIREALRIVSTDGAIILDYEFLDEREAGISNFDVEGTSLAVRNRKLPAILDDLKLGTSMNLGLEQMNVSWKHFDPGHGFRVRVIYSAEAADQLRIVGNVYGSGEPIDQGLLLTELRWPAWVQLIGGSIMIFGIAYLIMGALETKLLKLLRRQRSSVAISVFAVSAVFLIAASTAALGALLVFTISPLTPPL
jgi:hypothetical protein